MAELNTGRRLQPRVDLTAMVDLAFLLITFFMLTTTLDKEQALDVAMPSFLIKPKLSLKTLLMSGINGHHRRLAVSSLQD